MRVNRRELADILRITVPTVTAWVDKDAMPYTRQGSKGVEWEFDTAEVVQWYAQHKFKARDGRAKASARDNPFVGPGEDVPRETIDAANLRKESALADKHEIAAAREAALLVPIDEVAKIVLAENARVRARICALPNELRPLLLTHLKNDRKAVEQCISRAETAINEALTEIQSYAAGGDDGDDT